MLAKTSLAALTAIIVAAELAAAAPAENSLEAPAPANVVIDKKDGKTDIYKALL